MKHLEVSGAVQSL